MRMRRATDDVTPRAGTSWPGVTLLGAALLLLGACSESSTATPTPDGAVADGANTDIVVADTSVVADSTIMLDGGVTLDRGVTLDNAVVSDSSVASDVALTRDSATPDAGPGSPYDTTGWTMKTRTLSESASTGTPDSYFFHVDAASPLSASITGGGSGSWSVNVFGGSSNYLYCSGSSLCQVMLYPQDTTVIVTAITTGIGTYSLTVQYSGLGL